MRFEAARTRALFVEESRALPADDAGALKPAELMYTIYEKLLSRMEADGFRVFRKRYRLSKAEKLLILIYFRFFPRSFATSKRVGIT